MASCSPSEASDMKNPFLDYINDILMEEGMDDDATFAQQVNGTSYQAILSSFQETLGEQLSPISRIDSHSRADVFDPHNYYEEGPDEHHVTIVRANDEFHNVGNTWVSLPVGGHPQSRFHQGRAEVGFTLKHNSGFQGHTISSRIPTQIRELCEMKIDMYNSGSHFSSCGLNEASVSLSSSNNIVAQFCNNTIRLNDSEPMDAMVSCSHKPAAVEGPYVRRCMAEQEQGNHNFKLPSANYLKLMFEDLKLHDVYMNLYNGGLSSSGRESKQIFDKKEFMLGMCSKVGKKSTSSEQEFVDVKEVLVDCAKAVAIGDARKANVILQELRQVYGASADGTGSQRVAYFFSEALAARLRGMGECHYREICHNVPSALTMLKSSKLGFEVTPFMKLMHYLVNWSILKAAEGAARLHVVDFGLLYGMQWPCLMNALADRKGGPPLLVITGIESFHQGTGAAEMLQESGRRLAAYAKMYNVPFQFHAVVTENWEDLDAASLHLHEGELLVVNCAHCLGRLSAESVGSPLTISSRQKFLNRMCSLNPHLLFTAVMNAAFGSSIFVSRFRDALYCFSNVFDMLEVLWGDDPRRLILERICIYRDLVSIVACEGAERVERPETYKQWHARIMKAGFRQLPIPSTILSRLRSHVKQHYHKHFFMDKDVDGWMLIGWKGRAWMGISAWRPIRTR